MNIFKDYLCTRWNSALIANTTHAWRSIGDELRGARMMSISDGKTGEYLDLAFLGDLAEQYLGDARESADR